MKKPSKRSYRSSQEAGNKMGENNRGISQTIPDLAPSMRELLVRHNMGLVDNVSQDLSFTQDMPDLRNIEPHELRKMIDENRENLNNLQQIANAQAIKDREESDKRARERAKEIYQEMKKAES